MGIYVLTIGPKWLRDKYA